jgi:four helix bundle protein
LATHIPLTLNKLIKDDYMNFEKLDVWKRSAKLSSELYIELLNLKDWGFRDQITRSGLSIPSNIAEGMTRESEKEKARFINIAIGSAAELKTQLWIGRKISYIPTNVANQWQTEINEIYAMLIGLHRHLKSKL